MKNIFVVLGTRPEVIKLYPVIIRLKAVGYNVLLCNTGQQKELSNQALKLFKLKADYNLSVMVKNQSLAGAQAKILKKLDVILKSNDFKGVIVQGDTLSAFCGALSGFYNHIPVFHIEAGLRTHDIESPFPEEAYRKMIACLSTLHFTPSAQAKKNLIKEGVSDAIIYVTGNTIVDTLRYYKQKLCFCAEKKLIDKMIMPDKMNVLVTIHRRENHLKLKDILTGIKKLSLNFSQYRYIILLHPNPNVKPIIEQEFSKDKNVILLEPLAYDELIWLMNQCSLILTDSGGIQEDAAYQGIQTIILRQKTERDELLKFTYMHLVGTDPKNIYKIGTELLCNKFYVLKKCKVYGQGNAAQKIVKQIDLFLS